MLTALPPGDGTPCGGGTALIHVALRFGVLLVQPVAMKDDGSVDELSQVRYTA